MRALIKLWRRFIDWLNTDDRDLHGIDQEHFHNIGIELISLDRIITRWEEYPDFNRISLFPQNELMPVEFKKVVTFLFLSNTSEYYQVELKDDYEIIESRLEAFADTIEDLIDAGEYKRCTII